MKKLANKKIYHYKNYDDDLVKSKNQQYKIPENFTWVHSSFGYRLCAQILYKIALLIGFFYSKIGLHVKFINRNVLKKYKKQGYFLYGNHTQPIGDVFLPALACGKRIYTVVSQANLGIPVIGKILPMLGAIPVPDSVSEMKKMRQAISQRMEEGKCVVVYPEAHVWPYYTKIRPFPSTAFGFPVENQVPCFCMTTTYYKRKYFKKPGIKVYIDGPFLPDEKLSQKEKKLSLHDKIYDIMNQRSKNSTYEFAEYKGEQSE